MTSTTNAATTATGETDMGFFPYGTARDRVLLERGHRVWLENGTFACEAAPGLRCIPEEDWRAAEAALAAEEKARRPIEYRASALASAGGWPVYPEPGQTRIGARPVWPSKR